MLAVVFVYAGFAVMLAGAITFVRPFAIIGIPTRRRAAVVFAFGLASVALGILWPAAETRVAAGHAHIDEFAPVYQFNEVHSVRVHARRARVYQAIKTVPADEILFFRTLTWIRRLGRTGPESVLNAQEHLPILDVATRSGFVLLAEEPAREIVVGAVVLAPQAARARRRLVPDDFRNFQQAGFALATMNFLVEDAGADTSIVRTETRVYATDRSAASQFARYWRVIYPGSALIRRMWLRAIKQHAEK